MSTFAVIASAVPNFTDKAILSGFGAEHQSKFDHTYPPAGRVFHVILRSGGLESFRSPTEWIEQVRLELTGIEIDLLPVS